MKHFILPLFLFLFAVAAHADDIATIRTFLANPTDDAVVQHGVYMACLNLTRTGTEEAVPLLKQLLDDERFSTVARTALANIPGGMERATPAQPELPQDAALLALILRDGEPGLSALTNALKDDKASFNVILRTVLELKSDKTGTTVLANMGNLPVEKQAALVRNLGTRKDADIVPALTEMANGDKPELRLAAVEALGEIGDLRAVDAILLAIESEDNKLANAARESLKLFSGEEFDRKIIALLDHSDKNLVLAALDVIGARQIEAAGEKLKAWITGETNIPVPIEQTVVRPNVRDVELRVIGGEGIDIRMAAIRAFANSAPPTVENIATLIERLERSMRQMGIHSQQLRERMLTYENTLREAILTLCRRTGERDNVVNFFTNRRPFPVEFYLDCLSALGGEKAAEALATVAMGRDDALTDKATQLLGQWTTPEVAPFLIEIAEKHPVERYRSRTLRGYLRVIRQMGLPVEQKVQMAEKAVAVANAVGLSDADKEQAAAVLERFSAMVKGRPIFDGKTFDGWEFRGNEEWFRIEDGAIVGGSLERRNLRTEFVVSKQEYGDFTLWVECKAIGQGANGGIQFRSFRAPTGYAMIGYQADMTDTTQYWGAIYDETRRNRFIAEPPPGLIERIFRPGDWNEYKIVAKGNNVRLYLNGELTVDYTEEDENIPARGFIGLQIHGGSPFTETWYRNIRIEE